MRIIENMLRTIEKEFEELFYYILEFNENYVGAKKNGKLLNSAFQSWQNHSIDELCSNFIGPYRK